MAKRKNGAQSQVDVEGAALELRAAIDAKKAGQAPDRRAVLLKMKDLISEARAEGLSHARIAKTLSDNGVQVTKHDVARFCVHELGEVQVKRRRRRNLSRASPKSMTAHSPKAAGKLDASNGTPRTPTATKASPSSKPGFRVARDEDL